MISRHAQGWKYDAHIRKLRKWAVFLRGRWPQQLRGDLVYGQIRIGQLLSHGHRAEGVVERRWLSKLQIRTNVKTRARWSKTNDWDVNLGPYTVAAAPSGK